MSSKPPFDYEITMGDFGKVLSAVLTGANKQPVNLSEATSISMRLGRPGETPVASGLATKDPDQTANTGLVAYTWAAGDTDTPGEFEMTFVVAFPAARLTYPTDPLTVRIRRELAASA